MVERETKHRDPYQSDFPFRCDDDYRSVGCFTLCF